MCHTNAFAVSVAIEAHFSFEPFLFTKFRARILCDGLEKEDGGSMYEPGPGIISPVNYVG